MRLLLSVLAVTAATWSLALGNRQLPSVAHNVVSLSAPVLLAGLIVVELGGSNRNLAWTGILGVAVAAAARTLKVPNAVRSHLRCGLVVPQPLFVLAKLALVHSGDCLLPGVRSGNLVAALFTVAHYLAPEHEELTSTVITGAPGPLGREIIANQLFNARRSEATLMGRFVRRWLQLPKERNEDPRVVDLPAIFHRATGVPLDDLMTVGAALWAKASKGEVRVQRGYFATLRWPPERLDRVLGLISADIPTMRAAVRDEISRHGLVWAISTFGRWPVAKLDDGSVLVIDVDLLMRRVFGWLPLFDITGWLPPGAKRTKVERKQNEPVEQCVRYLGEIYALEVLHSIVGGPARAERIYDEAALKDAFYRKGQQIADAAIDYGDAWLVVEITTTQPTRETTVALDDEHVAADLDKLVEKVEQIDATIEALRRNETRLTGAPPNVRRRFLPLLVMAEGFPVNPITLTLLRERIEQQQLLRGLDVGPLEIADVEELEIIEGLQEDGGPCLRDLLTRKSTAGLARVGLREYILEELGLQPRRSRRLDSLWPAGLESALRALAHADTRPDERQAS